MEPITAVNHYGTHVYVGEKLAGYYPLPAGFTAADLAKLVGIDLVTLAVKWEDMPGCKPSKVNPASEFAPPTLGELRAHLARLAAKQKSERIAYLRAELARETDAKEK